ncbi:MAG: NAD(P)-dependent oxidoreductase [Clostridia bacterium]|nr:NAD(P)-dependent oxidoreductase [Clostridia bacterium]
MILIVGCGFLGSYLFRELTAATTEKVIAVAKNVKTLPRAESSANLSEYNSSALRIESCDVTDQKDVASLAEKCRGEKTTVFYFAACHNIDYVYSHPLEARTVNIDALKSFLETIPGIDRFFFSSTDCVYGENTSEFPLFDETAPLRPVNEYGRQKADAERIVSEHGFISLRFGYMLGKGLCGKPHFYDNIIRKMTSGEPLEMIDGMVRSLLSYKTASELLVPLLKVPKSELPGVINVCSDTSMTKYETALSIADSIGIDSPVIKRISEDEGRKFFLDNRASSSVMSNGTLKQLLGVDEIKWQPQAC